MKGVWKGVAVMAMALAWPYGLARGRRWRREGFEFKISVDTVPNHPRNMDWKSSWPELTKRSGESW